MMQACDGAYGRSLQHARQHAARCSRSPTACSMQHIACNMQQTSFGMQQSRRSNVPPRACSVQHAHWRWQHANGSNAHGACSIAPARRYARGRSNGAPAGSSACAGSQSTLDGASTMLNGVSFGSASIHATSRPRAEAAPNTITLLRKQPASAATAASARCAENDSCEARRIRALGIVLQINRVTVPHADRSNPRCLSS
jgi:hypothetical protein